MKSRHRFRKVFLLRGWCEVRCTESYRTGRRYRTTAVSPKMTVPPGLSTALVVKLVDSITEVLSLEEFTVLVRRMPSLISNR